MTSNRKLTKLLKGRVFDKAQQENGHLHIIFTDGSTLVILASPIEVDVRDKKGNLEYAD